MTYFFEYLVFLAEVATIVLAIVVVISVSYGFSARAQHDGRRGRLKVRKLNDRLRDLRHEMEATLLPPDTVKKRHKAEAKAEQQAQKSHALALKQTPPETAESDAAAGADTQTAPRRVFVLRFNGDVRASAVELLRTEVSAVLTMATSQDEVVVTVESPGGMVHAYGFAAAQLTRIRNKAIPLTVAVDHVAASGGYLMAAVANRIIASPFALLGSIGVVAQVPNVHRLLKKNDVDVEILTAGKHKRTLTVLGENTEEGREKFKEELEDVHLLFQEFVAEYRPQLDMAEVATGEAWYGKRALDHKLVDEIATSDEYLLDACADSEVFEVVWEEQKRPIERLLGQVEGLAERARALTAWLPQR